MDKAEVVFLSNDLDITQAVQNYMKSFDWIVRFYPKTRVFLEIGHEKERPNVVVFHFSKNARPDQILSELEIVRKKFQRSAFLILWEQVPSPELQRQCEEFKVEAWFEPEMVKSTTILFYFLCHFVHGQYYRVEANDLFPETELSFTCYRYLNLNRRYLPVAFRQWPLREKKFKRLQVAKDLFIRFSDTLHFQTYVETYNDMFKNGLRKRVRASLIHFMSAWHQTKMEYIIGKKNQPEFLEKALDQMVSYYLKSDDRKILYPPVDVGVLSEFDRSGYVCLYMSLFAHLLGRPDYLKIWKNVLEISASDLNFDVNIFRDINRKHSISLNESIRAARESNISQDEISSDAQAIELLKLAQMIDFVSREDTGDVTLFDLIKKACTREDVKKFVDPEVIKAVLAGLEAPVTEKAAS